MKVLTINELVERLTSSPISIERVYGQILVQCDIVMEEEVSHIGMLFENNNIKITVNEEGFFGCSFEEQLAMLKYIGALIYNEVRYKGVGKHAAVWNAASQIFIFQTIDNVPADGNLREQFDLPLGLTIEEYYEAMMPISRESGFIDIDEDYPIEYNHSEGAVTKIIIQVAESLAERRNSDRVERRKVYRV